MRPRGPLGFPRVTDIGPLVSSEITPVIDMEPGTYDFSILYREQDITAMDTMDMIRHATQMFEEGIQSLATFSYGEYSFDDIVAPEGFIPTLSLYADMEPGIMKQKVMEKDIPEEDIESLSLSYEHRSGDNDMRALKEAANKIEDDIIRVRDIKSDIESTLEYWPPTFIRKQSTLDGAHRTAALYRLLGPDAKIYAWELENPKELEMW